MDTSRLTPHELLIYNKLLAGLQVSVIARELKRNRSTVLAAASSIYKKVGVNSHLGLMRKRIDELEEAFDRLEEAYRNDC